MDKYRLEEHQQLLQSLKATVEGLLISQVSNVWNIYGGLNRLYNAMKNIFKHGCRVFTQDGEPDCWVFIQGLTWLQPALANSPTFFCEDKETFVHLPKGVTNDKASYWLFKSLEGHSLSQKLSWLLSDKSHLSSCYESYAFLCRREYGEAALVCLRAVEQSQPSLLTEIDPCLYLTRWKWQPFHKTHRRCSSFPETYRNKSWNDRFDDVSQTSDYHEEAPAIPIIVKDPKSDEDRLPIDEKMSSDSSSYQSSQNTEKQVAADKGKSKSKKSLNSDIRNKVLESEKRITKGKTNKRNAVDNSVKLMVDMGRCWSSLPSLFASKKEDEVRGRSSTMISSLPAKNTDGSVFESSSFHVEPLTNKVGHSRMSRVCGNLETSSSEHFDYQGKKQEIAYQTPRLCLPDETLMSELPNSPRNLLPAAASQRPCQLQLQASWVEEDKGISSNSGGNRINPDFLSGIVGSAPVGYPRENWQRRETQNQHTSNVDWQRNHGNPGIGHENTLSLLMGSSISSSSLSWRGGPISGIWSNRYRQSFLEAGGCGVVPMWTGFFPQPARGQSLTSFLSSGQFARSAAELDRENAHFGISEAMIAAIEQVKSNRQLGITVDRGDDEVIHKEEESDEEINQLKQRIRLRRRQLRQQKERNNHHTSEWNVPNILGDGKNDITTTEQSVSPFSSSSVGSFHSSTPSSSSTSPTYSLAHSPSMHERRKRNGAEWLKKGDRESSQSSVEELTLDDSVNGLTRTQDAGLSLSLASLYSDADLSHRKHAKTTNGSRLKNNIQKSERLCRVGCVKVVNEAVVVPLAEAAAECMALDSSEGEEKTLADGEGGVSADCSNHTVVSLSSAEGVALSLLRRFSEKQLPRASELEWLVSERDAPQQLLPLPGSWPVSPDEAEDEDMKQATPLRGTFEWAPPRPQIIFTPHPSPNHRVVMAKQGHRCAGCGMKVAPEYAHRFRYCEYLGRYFCTGCHSNQLALIPGRVLSKWDFTRCPVSIFSYRLLEQMLSDPLYNVGDLNPALYRKAKALERTRIIRIQLQNLKDFLLACRFASDLQECLEREPQYLSSDPEVYSLQDLVSVKSGELPSRLKTIVDAGIAHVAQCQLCMARGFVCELCASPEIIHPWQLPKVSRCAGCGACFHASCRDESKNSRKKGKSSEGTLDDSNPPCPRCARLSERQRQRMQPKLSEDETEEAGVGTKEENDECRKSIPKLRS